MAADRPEDRVGIKTQQRDNRPPDDDAGEQADHKPEAMIERKRKNGSAAWLECLMIGPCIGCPREIVVGLDNALGRACRA